jgi:Predicted membrane protein (DUF2079)
MRRVAGVATAYLAASVLLTWPLVTVLGTRLGALEGPGDPYLNLWILGWGTQSWLRDPIGTLAGRAFDAPIFHPSPLTLTFSDHQLLQALLVTPIYAATGNLTLAYNVVLVTSLAASGMAMHVLAKSVSGSTAAAFVAGLAWACWPYRTAHLLHLQLQALYFLPLALWALLRVAAARRWGDVMRLGLFAGGQAIVSAYYGIMTALALLVAVPVVAWTTGQWRARRYWTRTVVGGAVAALVVVPLALPYVRSQAAEGFGRSAYEAVNHAAALRSYAQVRPENALYGRTGWLAPRRPEPGERDLRHVEQQMFPGFVLLLLSVAGLVLGWRSDQRSVVVLSTVLVGLGVWLSLGPDGPLGLYNALARHAFGFAAIRAPARFGVVAMLGLCLLAGVGLSRVLRQPGSTWVTQPIVMPMIVIALMLAEYANSPLAFVEAPRTDTPVGRWLRDTPEPGAVLYWPVSLDRENTPYMIEALQHGRPIVNGYSGRRPLGYAAVIESLSTLPAAEGLAMSKALNVRFVVAPVGWRAATAGAHLVQRAAFGERAIFELRVD